MASSPRPRKKRATRSTARAEAARVTENAEASPPETPQAAVRIDGDTVVAVNPPEVPTVAEAENAEQAIPAPEPTIGELLDAAEAVESAEAVSAPRSTTNHELEGMVQGLQERMNALSETTPVAAPIPTRNMRLCISEEILVTADTRNEATGENMDGKAALKRKMRDICDAGGYVQQVLSLGPDPRYNRTLPTANVVIIFAQPV